jgi:hypothetical protein
MEKRESHLQKKIDQQLAEAKARSAKKDKKGIVFEKCFSFFKWVFINRCLILFEKEKDVRK